MSQFTLTSHEVRIYFTAFLLLAAPKRREIGITSELKTQHVFIAAQKPRRSSLIVNSVHENSIAELTFVCRNAKLLFKFSILWTRMRPLLGFPSFSPEMISSSFSSLIPSAKSTKRSSTSIFACNEANRMSN